MSSELAGAIEDETLHITRHDTVQVSSSGEITAVQRMLSACLGLLITSFAVTPFDVVRIRMQQQEVMRPEVTCCELFARSASSGPKPGAFSACPSSAPGVFWLNQHYCNSPQTCPRITSTMQGLMSISHNESPTALWRGLLLTLFMAVPANIIYFTGYEYIRDHSFVQSPVLNPLLCGSLARAIAATVIAPVELLKTRLQSIPSERGRAGAVSRSNVLASLVRDSMQAARTHGVALLFRGLGITLWRDVPFLGVYWLSYEFCKETLGRAMNVDFGALRQDDWRIFAVSFLSGSLSGLVAAFVTNPFDVGKTRLQIQADQAVKKQQSLFEFLHSIYKTEGVLALYRGFAPRVMKVVPLCAIMISSYEVAKKIFKDSM